MPRIPAPRNLFVYRTHLRVLLFAGIAVVIAWTAFTSYSARLDKSIKEANPAPEALRIPQTPIEADSRAKINKNYGSLPLSFEANRGQTDASVNFVARGPGYNIFLTPGEAVLALRGQDKNLIRSKAIREAVELNGERGARPGRLERLSEAGEADSMKGVESALVRMQLEGADANPRAVEGVDELPGKVNYFIGNDSAKWLTNIPTYSKIAYRDVYPGIDVVYYGNGGELEYDLVIDAGADPNAIKMKFDGVENLRMGRDGVLTLKTKVGDVQLKSPLVFQEVNGARKLIEGSYVIRGGNGVGFRVGKYDRGKPLIIDPILSYSSLVNPDTSGNAIAVDSNGFAYITGYAYDANPTAGVYQIAVGANGLDAFVTKLNQTGTNAVYSTYIGGNGEEGAFGIAVDAAGNAYITGYASGTFPTTPGAVQVSLGSAYDCFVTKLNATGSALLYSTFYGGNDFEEGAGIAVDGAGNAFVTGDTRSTNFITTLGALQSTNAGGSDGFLLRLNSNGSLGYATYLGGGGFDYAIGVAVDSSGNAYLTGQTSSFNLPQVNSLQGSQGTDRGFFRSTNNGSSWTLSNTGLTNSYVYAIAIDRNTPTTMYVGTAGGVSKSTDGGLTWVATAATNATVLALAIDPSNSSIVYAGTSSGVYKTTNGGASWTAINNGRTFLVGSLPVPYSVRTLAIDPSAPATIYSGGSGTLFKSTDGGANWVRLSGNGLNSSNIQSIVIDPATPATLYVGTNSSGIFKSTNAGVNWAAVNTGLATPANLSIRSLAVVPNAPATLYAGTGGGIFKTTNGGTSWSAVNNGLLIPSTDGVPRSPFTINAIAIDPVTPANVYAAASATTFASGVYGQSAILKSTDGGANWTAVTSGFGSLNNSFASLAINPANPAQVFAGNFGDSDGFIAKINSSGLAFIYATYVGSNRFDYGVSIAADGAGNSYITGVVGGTNLPVTPGAIRSSLSGFNDAFVMKLNPAGTSRLYSTYLGGGLTEDSYGIAVDGVGNAYLVGSTISTDFPVTPGAFQTTIGGRGNGFPDAFITKLNPDGSALVYSSYLGGVGYEMDAFADYEGGNIALDPLGNAYVVGGTDGITFPVLGYANAFSSAGGPGFTFVAKIDGNTPSYSITGQVLTNTGTPISNLIVEAKTPQGYSRFGITDAQGFYAIVSLPTGDYTVTPQKYAGSAHYLFAAPSRTFNALSADQTANFTGTQVYDIQGKVTSSTVADLGIFDVTMTLSGAGSATTITDANGSFIFRDLLPGSYTVTPSKTGFTFNPANISYTSLNANQIDANFTTASATFFSVGGHVADGASASVSGATITMVVTSQSGNRSVSIVTDAGGNYSFQNLQAGGNYTFSAAKPLLSFAPPSQTFNNLSANQTLNFTAANLVIQATLKTWTFQGRTYAYVKLSYPNAGFTVTNWGAPVRVANDFTVDAVVNVSTGASVQAATTTAQIYDLGPLTNGSYNFIFKNSGAILQSLAFTISSTAPAPNPIDGAGEFVRQQYRDFLNREADPAGEAFWTDNITKCSDPARRPPGQTEAQCTLRQRETTSGAFFLSPEFQYTGYYVYRMYVGALGRRPKLSEFTPDAQFVGDGIIVGGALSAAKINQNKADFAAQFTNCTDPAKSRCAEFKAMYDSLTNEQFVAQLFLKTKVNASSIERMSLVNALNGGTLTRGAVLQKVVDGIVVISEGNQLFTTAYGQAFYNAESNRAFVLLEYFGYMKRDPDDAGYAFWLAKLDQFGGNFVSAEMVLAFIQSPEYRARFGQP